MATNKYTDIEIQTAKKLLEQGYKWIYRSSFGTLYAYETKPLINEANYDVHYDLLCKSYVPIFQSVKSCDEPVSLEAIVHPQVLDYAEKRYLSAVIKPFRKHVQNIAKYLTYGNTEEYIIIQIDSSERVNFPHFKVGTMYKGMERGHKYTPEELGL